MAYYRIKEEVLEECLSPSYLNETKQYFFLHCVFKNAYSCLRAKQNYDKQLSAA